MNQDDAPLSADGRELLHRAQKEAERLDHEHVGCEHLLLAMTLQREGPVSAAL